MLDPTLLRTFLAVIQTRSFTQAAIQLGLQQSTVSQHVRRLEKEIGRRLFVRDTHSVVPTTDGDAMIEFAQNILEVNERAQSYFAGSELRGRIRFGTSEDFVLSRLPEVLRTFMRAHPLVALELTVAPSGILSRMLKRGELDLIFGKRKQGDEHGQLVCRHQLIWAADKNYRVDPSAPVPLILFPAPSITREITLAALEHANRPWRIACVSGSMSGMQAAALAGFGVLTVARGLLPGALTELQGSHDLPNLGDIEFVLEGRAGRGAAAKLADTILANGARLQGG